MPSRRQAIKKQRWKRHYKPLLEKLKVWEVLCPEEQLRHWDPELIPMIRKVYPKILAQDIIGVQPMLEDADECRRLNRWMNGVAESPQDAEKAIAYMKQKSNELGID